MLIERRKSKVKGDLVSCLFMKPFSQNFKNLTQRGDVINPTLAQKTHIDIHFKTFWTLLA